MVIPSFTRLTSRLICPIFNSGTNAPRLFVNALSTARRGKEQEGHDGRCRIPEGGGSHGGVPRWRGSYLRMWKPKLAPFSWGTQGRLAQRGVLLKDGAAISSTSEGDPVSDPIPHRRDPGGRDREGGHARGDSSPAAHNDFRRRAAHAPRHRQAGTVTAAAGQATPAASLVSVSWAISGSTTVSWASMVSRSQL